VIDFWNRRIAWVARYLGTTSGTAASAQSLDQLPE
jgi:hypothetical protein